MDNRVVSVLHRAFYNKRGKSYFNMSINEQFHSNDPYKNLFVVDISEDEFEVPVYAKYLVEETLAMRHPATEIVIPLYGTNCVSRRNSDIILTDLLSNGARLTKVRTPSGKTYYGGPGLIMDKEFHPLLTCTLSCSVQRDVNGYMSKVLYSNPTICVSPKVFCNMSDIVNKAIIGKIIPYYIYHDIYCYDTNINGALFVMQECEKARVCICDTTGYIVNPVKPSINTHSDELINQLLAQHSDELINQLINDN